MPSSKPLQFKNPKTRGWHPVEECPVARCDERCTLVEYFRKPCTAKECGIKRPDGDHYHLKCPKHGELVPAGDEPSAS